MENFTDGDGSNGRGTGGPLKVSTVPDQNPLYDALFKAAVAAGYKLNSDYNSEDQEGVVKTQTSIHRGRRMSVAHCYLEPAMKRSNLHVVTEAMTLRVLLDGKRCIGVEYEKAGKVEQARGRETILSAGGVASPQILELSGIGQPELLKKFGIEVKHELAAVGENFRDHINARIIWRVKDARVSYNHMARGVGAVTQMMKYLATGGGFMSLPSAPLLAFLRTRPELATPDVQMHLVPYSIKDPKTRKLQDFPSMTIACYQLRPESLGSIHIRSANPKDQPAIRRSDRSACHDRWLPHDAENRRRRTDGYLSRRGVFARSVSRQRRRDPDLDPQQLADRLPSDRYLPYGSRPQCRGRRQAESAWPRRPTHRRRLDLPDHAFGQHQCAEHHGGREGGRPAARRGVTIWERYSIRR
jgi:choline dehydrogenase